MLYTFDHFGVAHTRHATSSTNVSWDTLQCHHCTSPCLFSNACLIRCCNVHNHTALEHLCQVAIECCSVFHCFFIVYSLCFMFFSRGFRGFLCCFLSQIPQIFMIFSCGFRGFLCCFLSRIPQIFMIFSCGFRGFLCCFLSRIPQIFMIFSCGFRGFLCCFLSRIPQIFMIFSCGFRRCIGCSHGILRACLVRCLVFFSFASAFLRELKTQIYL